MPKQISDDSAKSKGNSEASTTATKIAMPRMTGDWIVDEKVLLAYYK